MYAFTNISMKNNLPMNDILKVERKPVKPRTWLYLTILLPGLLIGCSALGQPTYSDPFLYCSSKGTIDTPDSTYTGASMPDTIIQKMIEKGIIAPDAPKDFQSHAVWRCMGGSVFACHFGANLPCQEKADTKTAPTAEMNDFCQSNPGETIIPASVTGRATVFEWKCENATPTINRQIFHADERGFIAEIWYQLS